MTEWYQGRTDIPLCVTCARPISEHWDYPEICERFVMPTKSMTQPDIKKLIDDALSAHFDLMTGYVVESGPYTAARAALEKEFYRLQRLVAALERQAVYEREEYRQALKRARARARGAEDTMRRMAGGEP